MTRFMKVMERDTSKRYEEVKWSQEKKMMRKMDEKVNMFQDINDGEVKRPHVNVEIKESPISEFSCDAQAQKQNLQVNGVKYYESQIYNSLQPLVSKGHKDMLDSYWLVLKAMAQWVDEENDELNERKMLSALSEELNFDCNLVWLRMKSTTLLKLWNLVEFEDHELKNIEMSIHNWLIFDMVLVHQNYDVIGMTDITQLDKQILVDLFKLVVNFQIEYLSGDELAEAWSALTMSYNNSKRHCTPMLLQRRWYQLKLATKKRFLKYYQMYKDDKQDPETTKKFKPTLLQAAIVARFESLLVEPFISWKALIKANKVILRQQFQLIALKKQAKNVDDDVIIVNDDSKPKFAENNIRKDDDQVSVVELDVDEVIKKALFLIAQLKQMHHDMNEEILLNIKPPVLLKEINKNEIKAIPNIGPESTAMDIDIEETIKCSVIPKEMVLPKITNVFGNVHVSNETLSKINVLTTQIESETDKLIINLDPVEEKAIDTVSSELPTDPCIAFKVFASDNWSNNGGLEFIDCGVQLRDAEIFQSNDGNGEIKMEIDDTDTTMFEEITENKLVNHTKLFHDAVVYAFKLEDMGILPTPSMGKVVLNRADDKTLLDVISFKSKLGTKQYNKDTYTVKTIRRVKLSSDLLQKPCNRAISIMELIKNPDFNWEMKMLPPQFCKSIHNRVLLESLKPLTVDLSKEFETELVNGTMYLDTSEENYEYAKNLQTHTNYLNLKNKITNTNSLSVAIDSLQNGEKKLPSERCCWAPGQFIRRQRKLLLCNNSEYIRNKNIQETPIQMISEFNRTDDISNKEKDINSDLTHKNLAINSIIFLTTAKIPSNLKTLVKFQRKIKHILDKLKNNREAKKCNPPDCEMSNSGSILRRLLEQPLQCLQSSAFHDHILPDWKITGADLGMSNSEILLQHILQLPLHHSQSPSLQFDKVKCNLGKLLNKVLTPVTSVSELLYAYICNGLFYTLDLDTQSLKPINIYIKGLQSRKVPETVLKTR